MAILLVFQSKMYEELETLPTIVINGIPFNYYANINNNSIYENMNSRSIRYLQYLNKIILRKVT